MGPCSFFGFSSAENVYFWLLVRIMELRAMSPLPADAFAAAFIF
jgi:hypothetical protein